jgi:predicted Zn-dependent peptidase
MQSYLPCSPDNINKVDEAYMRLIEESKIPGNITRKDWDRVRETAIETYKVNIKRNQYWLSNLQNANLYGMDPERILTVEKRLNAITTTQLEETARKYFTNQNIFKGYWLPENK